MPLDHSWNWLRSFFGSRAYAPNADTIARVMAYGASCAFLGDCIHIIDIERGKVWDRNPDNGQRVLIAAIDKRGNLVRAGASLSWTPAEKID
jgi:hypothetical protein